MDNKEKTVSLFEEHYQSYEDWFKKHPAIIETEAAAFRSLLPVGELKGIEVGIGAGHLAKAIGIREGVEPSDLLRGEAIKKGLEVTSGRAEDLPYKDLKFDFVIIGTAMHYFDDINSAFSEAFRVLKHNGILLLGYIDAEGQMGKNHIQNNLKSTFYKNATFYKQKTIERKLTLAGFGSIEHFQTLFGEENDITDIQPLEKGTGKGSFIMMRAKKSIL